MFAFKFEITFDNLRNLLTLILSIVSLIISIYTNITNKLRNSYITLDNQYKDLLAKGMQSPYLRSYTFACNYFKYKDSTNKEDNDKYYSYCSYAYMIWNFLETIYDIGSKKKKGFIGKVWTPVLMAENKLHYKWFIDNQQYFRKDFRDFVINKLNQLMIVDGNLDSFKYVYNYLLREFPPNEMKDKNQMIELLLNGTYQLAILRFKERHIEDHSIIGYALYYLNKDKTMMFLDYINILDDYQNCGYGSLFLKMLLDKLDKKGKGIFFEIEPQIDVITERRAKFYFKNGACKVNCDYYLPINNNGKLKLDLMCLPCNGVTYIDKLDIKNFIKEAVSKIHTDYSHTADVINSYINTIEDIEIINKVDLTFEQLNECEKSLIKRQMEHDFNQDYQFSTEQLDKLLSSKEYNLFVIRDKYRNFIGYTLIYENPKNQNFVLVDYLSIPKPIFEKGYGELIINYLKNKYNKLKYGLLFELPPSGKRKLELNQLNNSVLSNFTYYYPSENDIT